MRKKDNIFADSLGEIVDFEFDSKVANVFEDMLNRSIPGYSTIISTIGMLTKLYAKPDTNYYDLGSSLGAAALSMRRNIEHSGCRIIAADNSEAMIKRSRELIAKDNSPVPVELLCEDIRNVTISNASVVVLNFTLQFINPAERGDVIQKIYNGLNTGGILILSEKIIFEDKALNERQVNRYHDFKRLRGYSDTEINRKKEALENVLIPETPEEHFRRLARSGFKTYDIWHQLFNFISIVAEK
jgi:tRNA (cmo5U34)-methyltransferase